MRKILILAIAAVGFSASGLRAQERDDIARRLKAAAAYEKVTPVKAMTDSIFAEMARNPQFGMTQEDIAAAKANLDDDEMRKVVIETMAKHFSEAELLALAEFYGTPEGRSIVEKFPAYTADVMPYVQEVTIRAAFTALQAKQK